jgi:hypothetical protein
MADFSNIDFARENEDFAAALDIQENPESNWIVTINFYSLLHYIEERLQAEGYDSDRHKERMKNIRRCPAIDNSLYKYYRFLYDISRDARYECHRMGESEVAESEERLEKGKEELGFISGSGSGHKYSTS